MEPTKQTDPNPQSEITLPRPVEKEPADLWLNRLCFFDFDQIDETDWLFFTPRIRQRAGGPSACFFDEPDVTDERAETRVCPSFFWLKADG